MAKKNETAQAEKPFDQETDEDIAKTAQANQALEVVGKGVAPSYVPVDFEDALKHLEETGEIVTWEGSPWHVVNKDVLCGVPFIIMGYRVNDGDFGAFVSLMAVTKVPVNDGTGREVDRVVINDGSTGIKDQYMTLLQMGKPGTGLLCPGGLRKSEYTYTDDKGVERPATTYYIG